MKKHKGLVKDKSFTGFDQLAELVDSSEDVVERIVTSFKDAEDYRDTFNENPESKFTLAAKVKEKDGKFGVGYCRAGELLIESIEEATAELGAPVVISGEYMLGSPSEGWGGAH